MYLVGRDLGVQDEFNLCTDGAEQAVEYSDMILKQVVNEKFGSLKSSETCQEMAKHLLDGVNILNPFIDPAAFNLWSVILMNPDKKSEPTGLKGFSQFMLKAMILVLEWLIHVPVLGIVIRLLANNLMKLNIYLAADWSTVIVNNYNSPKMNMGLGQLQAFLAIPVFTFFSAASIAREEIGKNKMFLMFLILIFTTFTLL